MRTVAPSPKWPLRISRGQRVLNLLLDHALQRPCAVGRVVAFAGDRVERRVGHFQAACRAARSCLRQPLDLQLDDLANLLRDRADGK